MDIPNIISVAILALITVGVFLFAHRCGVRWKFSKNAPVGKMLHTFTTLLALMVISSIFITWVTDPALSVVNNVIIYVTKVYFFVFVTYVGYAMRYYDELREKGRAVNSLSEEAES